MILAQALPHYQGALPAFVTSGAAAMDLRAAVTKPFEIFPEEEFTVPTGLRISMSRNMAALLLPRSGLGSSGLVLRNTVGLIDSDYRGEILLKMAWRPSVEDVLTIHPGDRVAQMLFLSVMRPQISYVEDLDETERSIGGFGSTGI